MTEYELFDLINGISSNIVQGQSVYLTTITAYLVVAYSVGAKLTRFQVFFVSFVYIQQKTHLHGCLSQFGSSC